MVRIGILGATGSVGEALIRVLIGHPEATLAFLRGMFSQADRDGDGNISEEDFVESYGSMFGQRWTRRARAPPRNSATRAARLSHQTDAIWWSSSEIHRKTRNSFYSIW